MTTKDAKALFDGFGILLFIYTFAITAKTYVKTEELSDVSVFVRII